MNQRVRPQIIAEFKQYISYHIKTQHTEEVINQVQCLKTCSAFVS